MIAHYVKPDAMIAAAACVLHNYGHTGYVLGIASSNGADGVFDVRHADGSEFQLRADRWGNVVRIGEES